MGKHSNPGRGIYLRGASYWLTYQVKGKRTRVSLETDDFPKAVERAEELRAHPTLQPSEGISGDVERFIAYKRDRGEFTRSSAESKGAVLAKFAEWTEKVATASVTSKMMQRWYDEMRKKRADSTANSYLMMTSSFFQWAIDVAKITPRH